MDQPAVQHHLREWVRRFELQPHIRLRHEVTSVEREDEAWTVHTTGGNCRADYLVVASGVQNEPRVPEVERAASEIEETHSFELRRPGSLGGQRVAVVGGGASSAGCASEVDPSVSEGSRRGRDYPIGKRECPTSRWPTS